MTNREKADVPDIGDGTASTQDMDRRTALKNIGVLAGAAPAVTLLLTPSASRAWGRGGSPCEDHGNKHCGGSDDHDHGHGWGYGWGHGKNHEKDHDKGRGWGWGHDRDRDRGGKPGGGSKKPKGRDL